MTQMKIDAELLIALVENRPIVWDKTLKNYKEKTSRINAWREICIIMKEDFEKMEKKERDNYGKAVVKKWNQLRDSWTRSLNVIKNAKKSGSGSVPMKKYCYHNQMLFLKKVINPAETQDGELENTINQNNEHELSVAHERTDQENPSSAKRSKTRDVAGQTSAMDLKMMYFIDNQMKTKNNSQNEDRNMSFFKSLIPTLGLLDDDQVLELQAGVIHLLQKIKRRNRTDED